MKNKNHKIVKTQTHNRWHTQTGLFVHVQLSRVRSKLRCFVGGDKGHQVNEPCLWSCPLTSQNSRIGKKFIVNACWEQNISRNAHNENVSPSGSSWIKFCNQVRLCMNTIKQRILVRAFNNNKRKWLAL